MSFESYQADVVRLTQQSEMTHEVLPMLAMGGHVGQLLLTHQQYLADALVAETSKGMVARELGVVLRAVTLLGHLNGLSLDSVARTNLRKVDERARGKELPGITKLPGPDDALTPNSYQKLSSETDEATTAGTDPLGLSIPMLGLAGEAGSLLVEQKKVFRRDSEVRDWAAFVSTEIGDMLWYVAAVARHVNIPLEDILSSDLRRIERLTSWVDGPAGESSLDLGFKETERFPRQLQLHFEEWSMGGVPTVSMTLIGATPNAFPSGPIPRGSGKVQGFAIGKPLGDQVNDNSRRADAYRFHDAIHLGFLAILGWSPNLRGLLELKRKSNQVVDSAEDGARAVFAEEGLAAILAKQAPASRQFATPNLVPEYLLDLISMVVEDLEVADLPYQLWRRAISQGFGVMVQLAEAGGGYVLADLDTRTLQHSKFPFPS